MPEIDLFFLIMSRLFGLFFQSAYLLSFVVLTSWLAAGRWKLVGVRVAGS